MSLIDSEEEKNIKIDTFLRSKFSDFSKEEVEEGVSTNVYRVVSEEEIYYLRMSSSPDEMMSPQVLAHEKLLAKGVKVPRVVHWSDDAAVLGSPYMLTNEIPGISLESLRVSKPVDFEKCISDVLFHAGRDLKSMVEVSVNKYGWVDRDISNTDELLAYEDSNLEFFKSDFENRLQGLRAKGLELYKADEVVKLFELAETYLEKKEDACLAHGDFDLSHIYVLDGEYQGIIDWGDIRGASQYYDIAHITGSYPEAKDMLFRGFGNEDDNIEMKIRLERAAILIKKLWWISENLPRNYTNHKFISVLKQDYMYFKKYFKAIK